MEKLVYLAGPIKGLSYGACTGWRQYASEQLRIAGITALSPMRAKEYLQEEKAIGNSYSNHVLSSSKGIVARDRFDVQRCRVMLANLLGAENVTIGTMVEYGWADAYRKPVITVMEKEGNVHDHTMIQEITAFRVETLEEGLLVARALLCT
jgi:nucleoside 2-deoxyribosyltransferase